MRPMYVTGFVIEKQGDGYIVTFENNTRMTTVKLGTGVAVKLVSDLKDRIEAETGAR